MKPTAFPLLFIFGLLLGIAPVLITATFPPPLPLVPWTIDCYYYDTFDGTSRGSYSEQAYEKLLCRPQSWRCDWGVVTLKQRFRFIGWDNLNCQGDPIFEIKGRNLSYWVPPKNWESWGVLLLEGVPRPWKALIFYKIWNVGCLSASRGDRG